jgi:hypothetical protein
METNTKRGKYGKSYFLVEGIWMAKKYTKECYTSYNVRHFCHSPQFSEHWKPDRGSSVWGWASPGTWENVA